MEEATIDELHQAIRAGQTSCLAVVRHYLARVRAFNGVASARVTQDGAPTLESTGTVRAGAPLRFPCDTVKAGFGIGGEYGEGALHIRGRTAGYYNIVSASIGFQFGAQARSVIIMFMTEAALANFQRTDGWKVGIDGSIAIITVGAGGQIDTNSIRSPVIGFIFDQKGLMYNLTLEGSKISRIQR